MIQQNIIAADYEVIAWGGFNAEKGLTRFQPLKSDAHPPVGGAAEPK